MMEGEGGPNRKTINLELGGRLKVRQVGEEGMQKSEGEPMLGRKGRKEEGGSMRHGTKRGTTRYFASRGKTTS